MLISFFIPSTFITFINSRKEDKEGDITQLKLHSTLGDMQGVDIGLPCIRFFKLPHKVVIQYSIYLFYNGIVVFLFLGAYKGSK